MRIARLREELRAAEATSFGQRGESLTFGLPAIDDALGGGLARGALHEITAACEPESTTATGFALALAMQANRVPRAPPLSACGERERTELAARGFHPDKRKTVVWIAEDLSVAENGALYGPGFDETGIAPERLIAVAGARPRDVLWAMEEALRCRAVDVVIGELRAHEIDQVATRRLALAAAAGNTLGLFLRTAPSDDHSAAVTRWIIGATSSASAGKNRSVGAPRLTARLVRNRRGHLGTWIVEWNSVEQRFKLATDSEPVAGPPFDRSHRAAVA
jgi:protein ImuA